MLADVLYRAPEAAPLTRRSRTAQAQWAVTLLMRENPPGRVWCEDPQRLRLETLDVDLALGAFSRGVSHGGADDRLAAVNALVWLRDRRAISPFVRALRDREWDVRLAATEGLRQLAPLPDWAFSPLQRAVADEDSAVRAAAAQALGTLPSPDSVAALVPLVTDSSHTVRLAAVWALEQLGSASFSSSSAALALGGLLDQQDDPFVAFAAYWALAWWSGDGIEERRRSFLHSAWGQIVWSVADGP
jgi:hypothetical protein